MRRKQTVRNVDHDKQMDGNRAKQTRRENKERAVGERVKGGQRQEY